MLRYQSDLPSRLTIRAWSVGAKTQALNDLLFEHGMNPSQPDWLMITSLHQFAKNGNVEKANQIFDRGAAIDARDEDLCSTPRGTLMEDRLVQVRDRFVALSAAGRRTSSARRSRTVLSFAGHFCSLGVLAFLAIGHQSVSATTPADGATETATLNFNGSKEGDQREVANIRLCWCPPGRFLMGSPVNERGHRMDEAQVEVTLTQGFWMGKYEVSQSQWRKVKGDLPGIVNADVGDEFPVYSVSFVEAGEFCRRLTALAHESRELPSDWEFRLPTEAQWEYACRAGSTTPFSSGVTLNKADARFGMPYNGTPTGVPGSASSRVGSYAANAWGLHDMHGNEWEWCRDWYHAQLPGGVDPDLLHEKGLPTRDGTYSRVRRGGAWVESAAFCRSAARLRYEPERRADHIGFRVTVIRRS